MPTERPPRCDPFAQGLATPDVLALLVDSRNAPPKALMARYYRTPWFRALKAFHVERVGHCQIWQEHTTGLTLHHNSYRRLFAELDGDVLVVCQRDHRGIHFK